MLVNRQIRPSTCPWASPVIIYKKKDGGLRFYSKLDLKSGYFQLPIDENDKEKTAFITQDELRSYIDNVYVTIETDHKPLENCHRKQINNKRVINWLFKLQDLISQIVEVKYRINLGAKNTTANYISRHFPLSCKPTSLTEHFYFC
ncbi:unnamed protein product [Adineta steineri]|uniref:Reverse transcriptase RNase H-like domain-containing protein n=1 Tax=Adineta steineri TaxID=433720 RepID=A0A819LEF6_9BILA|nr:unnamed protein product [Adineta steineri]CAF3959981.1 unnamed protein product [Adineta steineri]